ncbi:hypothetical protein KNE206_07310 [Kitasatospora sp. NE20-6]
MGGTDEAAVKRKSGIRTWRMAAAAGAAAIAPGVVFVSGRIAGVSEGGSEESRRSWATVSRAAPGGRRRRCSCRGRSR